MHEQNCLPTQSLLSTQRMLVQINWSRLIPLQGRLSQQTQDNEPMRVQFWASIELAVLQRFVSAGILPLSKHKTLNQCWGGAGPASQTV